MTKLISLGIILPCFNESQQIENTFNELKNQIQNLMNKNIIKNVVICFVDDGSLDNTWNKIINIKKIVSQNEKIKITGIKFSKNFGHQYALLAGIKNLKNKVDCILTMDSDLEQDIKVLPEFISNFLNGNEIVLGIRKKRKSLSVFKLVTAKLFYIIANLLKLNLEREHADYRLISSRVAHEISNHNEYYIFLRGLIKNIGFKTSKVYYNEDQKLNRKSRYTKIKMIELAINGITSYSITPIRLLSLIGFLIILFSTFMIFYILYVKIFLDIKAPGWASTVLPIYFIGGVNLFFLGIVGEYIGKIYIETKQRPRFIIEEILED